MARMTKQEIAARAAERKELAAMEKIVKQALTWIRFVYGEDTEQDNRTVRAMVLKGATLQQIKDAIGIAAVNQRVETEDKSKYAYGVIRNMVDGEDE